MPVPESGPTLQRPSARSLVFETLRDWIEAGQLAPGEIVKDVDVAQTLGVSRTPVREALQMLQTLGLVVTSAGRYTRVAAASLHDAVALYPVLGRLMSLAVEVAGPELTPADFQEMEDANSRLLRAANAGDFSTITRADNEFHSVFVTRAANHYLSRQVKGLQVHARRLETMYFSELQATRESHDEHRHIISAAREGNFPKAAELTRKNFERTPGALLDRPAKGPVTDHDWLQSGPP